MAAEDRRLPSSARGINSSGASQTLRQRLSFGDTDAAEVALWNTWFFPAYLETAASSAGTSDADAYGIGLAGAAAVAAGAALADAGGAAIVATAGTASGAASATGALEDGAVAPHAPAVGAGRTVGGRTRPARVPGWQHGRPVWPPAWVDEDEEEKKKRLAKKPGVVVAAGGRAHSSARARARGGALATSSARAVAPTFAARGVAENPWWHHNQRVIELAVMADAV